VLAGARAFILGGQQPVEPQHRRWATADDDNCLEIRQADRRFLE
jgi:hypothetical protein